MDGALSLVEVDGAALGSVPQPEKATAKNKAIIA
jgi:hypothetical protein